jgi:hypothetical protein
MLWLPALAQPKWLRPRLRQKKFLRYNWHRGKGSKGFRTIYTVSKHNKVGSASRPLAVSHKNNIDLIVKHIYSLNAFFYEKRPKQGLYFELIKVTALV